MPSYVIYYFRGPPQEVLLAPSAKTKNVIRARSPRLKSIWVSRTHVKIKENHIFLWKNYKKPNRRFPVILTILNEFFPAPNMLKILSTPVTLKVFSFNLPTAQPQTEPLTVRSSYSFFLLLHLNLATVLGEFPLISSLSLSDIMMKILLNILLSVFFLATSPPNV